MSNWRRIWIPGGTYFFTLVTDNRAPILATPIARELLRVNLQRCRSQWPFEILAIVLLPDHLHTLWRLPEGDDGYPQRLGWIKKEFTKAWLNAGGEEQAISASRQRHRRRGVWQRKYWEHTIRNEQDLARHFDYVYYNPVKHGHVARPTDWPWTTLHRDIQAGIYPPNWACEAPEFSDIAENCGE